jgi:hypothetical protein
LMLSTDARPRRIAVSLIFMEPSLFMTIYDSLLSGSQRILNVQKSYNA